MSNEIFVKRSIEVLPKRKGWYVMIDEGEYKTMNAGDSVFFNEEWKNLPFPKHATYYWLEPITIEQYLSEHPEIVEKIRTEAFQAGYNYAKWKLDNEIYGKAAKDYIDSLKQTQP